MFSEEYLQQFAAELSPHLIPALGDYIIAKLREEKAIPEKEEKMYYTFEVLKLHLKDPDRWPKVSESTLRNYVREGKLKKYGTDKKQFKESELLAVLSQKGSRSR